MLRIERGCHETDFVNFCWVGKAVTARLPAWENLFYALQCSLDLLGRGNDQETTFPESGSCLVAAQQWLRSSRFLAGQIFKERTGPLNLYWGILLLIFSTSAIAKKHKFFPRSLK